MNLTKNFHIEEFNCHCGCETPEYARMNIILLADELQKLRVKLGKPIVIHSGYRCKEHNEDVEGAKFSQHLLGKAADFRVPEMDLNEVYVIITRMIESGEMEQGGLHLYSSFIHYDIRGTKARW